MLYKDNIFVFYRFESIYNFMQSRSDVQKRAWIRYVDIMAVDYSPELHRSVQIFPFWPMILDLKVNTGTEHQMMRALPRNEYHGVETVSTNVRTSLRLTCRMTYLGQLYLTYVGCLQHIYPAFQEPFRYQCWRYGHLQAGVWHLLQNHIRMPDTLSQG